MDIDHEPSGHLRGRGRGTAVDVPTFDRTLILADASIPLPFAVIVLYREF